MTDLPPPVPPPPALTWGEKAGLGLGLALVLWFYGWTAGPAIAGANAGGPPKDFYTLLVHALSKGQLHLDVPVDPVLAAAANPYDPAVWREHTQLPDASFFRGRYYIYFGVVPAVLFLLPYHLLTGHDLGLPIACLLLATFALLSLTALWTRTRSAFFPPFGFLSTVLVVLVFGLGTGAIAAVRRPHVWDFPIVAGFFFATLMLHCLLSALRRERAWPWLAAAGVMLGLAVGSRPTLLGLVLAAGAVFALRYRIGRTVGAGSTAYADGIRAIGGFCVGCGVILALLGWYNHARFGNPLEFGLKYQLTEPPHYQQVSFSAAFIPFNLKAYLAGGLNWSRYFPFATMADHGPLPDGHAPLEAVFGQLWYGPAIWFALAAALAWWPTSAALRGQRSWVLVLAAAFIGSSAADLCFKAVSWRYVIDFMPPLLLLSAIGVAALRSRMHSNRGRFLLHAGWGVAATMTAGVAALFSIPLWGVVVLERGIPYYEQFARFMNGPTAFVEKILGWEYGPVRFEGLTLPATVPTKPEKLLQTPHAAALVEYRPDGQARFGVTSSLDGVSLVHWSPPQRLAPGSRHTLSISLGALFPSREHPYYRHQAFDPRYRSTLAVELDGVRIIEEFRPFEAGDSRTFKVVPSGGPPASGWFTGSVTTVKRGEPLAPNDLATRFAPRTVSFSVPPQPGTWPLISTGSSGLIDTLLLETVEGGMARLAYAHTGSALRRSPPFPASPGAQISFDLLIEQFSPSGGLPAVAGMLAAESNGRTLWLESVPYHPSSAAQVRVGSAPADSAAQARDFPSPVKLAQGAGRLHPQAPTDHLLLKVVFPEKPRWGLRQPLLVATDSGQHWIVSLRHFGGGVARFELEQPGARIQEGPLFSNLDSVSPYWIEVFREPAKSNDDPSATGIIRVRFSGLDGLRAVTSCPDAAVLTAKVGLGAARIAGYEARFTGEFLLVHWVPAPSPQPANN